MDKKLLILECTLNKDFYLFLFSISSNINNNINITHQAILFSAYLTKVSPAVGWGSPRPTPASEICL